MRIAVISDIHGNLEAFQAVLERIRGLAPDRIISLGDNIGYGPDPEPVMQHLETHQILSILGNHEMVIRHPRYLSWFNPQARESVTATSAGLSRRSTRQIATWHRCLVLDGIRFVHGMPPRSPFLYPFQLTETGLARKIRELPETICFCGHTHELELIQCTGSGTVIHHPLTQGKIQLEAGSRWLVNAGSVGQPRDENKDAKLLLFDDTDRLLEVVYVPYDYETTARKIRDAGLPDAFARRLYPG